MKKTIRVLICVLLLWGITACRGNGNEPADKGAAAEENISTSDQEPAESGPAEGVTSGDPVLPLTDYVSEELYASADQWGSCDDTALAAVMKKAAAGEKVTIACIGGSITQGTISKGSIDNEVGFKKGYADIFFMWWQDHFPLTDFEFINAGIGGTDSYLGVHRVQKDVLEHEPDLVLVEFSVNDTDSQFYKKSYDNLVRKILLSDSSPAVMLLYMGQTNKATAQGSHVFIGFNYKLPMVSYSSLINDMMEQKVYTAAELSGDEVHPSALGHAIAGEILWKYLNNVYADVDNYGEPEKFTAAAVTKDTYLNAWIADSENITPDSLGTFTEKTVCSQFPNGWVCSEGDGEFTVTMTFQNLGILYYATVEGKSGQFDIFIDGEKVHTIDADFSGGWGNAITAEQVYTSQEEAEHTVTIKKSPESSGEVFDLLGLLVS